MFVSGVSIHLPQGSGGEGRETKASYTKPAFLWSCLLSHTNSRYRRRTHEVLAVKALLLVCKKNPNRPTMELNPGG